MQILGGIIIAIGAFLWCGNVFNFFPTFPLAGYITMAVGGFVMKKGGKPAAEQAESNQADSNQADKPAG